MTRLDDSIDWAVKTHKDQLDKGDNPYILHPLRMLAVVEYRIRPLDIPDKESVLCSTVLHDCIEDSKFDRMKARMEVRRVAGPIVEKTVMSLTRDLNESWNNYIKRVGLHWAPRLIKIIDLEDNMDTTRLNRYDSDALDRNKMYSKALIRLKAIGGLGIA